MVPSTIPEQSSSSSIENTTATTTTTISNSTSNTNNTNSSSNSDTGASASSTLSSNRSPIPFSDRILSAEHRFTALTQNIAHFSPLKLQLDKHNITIEKLENEIKTKTDSESESLISQQQQIKESLESLNHQLLAAKILHIGLTRQVAQYFESRSALHTLLEEIFSGTTPEHPSEDALEQELNLTTLDIQKTKDDFEKYRNAKKEMKEARRYIDFWNDAVEKQVASNAKDISKSFKKFVPFRASKAPSYVKTADNHIANARAFVPTLVEVGVLSDVKLDTIANTSNDLMIFTAKFKDAYNSLSLTLENLQRSHKNLKKKKNQYIEKLFDERSRIFSEELQTHYRNVGQSLTFAGEEDVDGMGPISLVDENSGQDGGGGGGGGGGIRGSHQMTSRPSFHRQHVEQSLGSYSTDGSCSLGLNSQEILLGAEEPPSYFQHERDETIGTSISTTLHRLSNCITTDSPPDYVQEEHLSTGLAFETRMRSSSGASTSMGMSAAEDEEDAQFRAYHERYDSNQREDEIRATRPPVATIATVMDMPPGYEETRYHSVVDP
ncbi:hypothetical protein BGZ76_001796, partial [Entomortierella beljakovae]